MLPQEEWQGDKYNEQVNVEDITPWKIPFLSQAMKETGNRTGRPVALEGTEIKIAQSLLGRLI